MFFEKNVDKMLENIEILPIFTCRTWCSDRIWMKCWYKRNDVGFSEMQFVVSRLNHIVYMCVCVRLFPKNS